MTKRVSKIAFSVALGIAAAVASAFARPPTVMNSPGYERALRESRKEYQQATQSAPTVVQPASSPKKKPALKVRKPGDNTR